MGNTKLSFKKNGTNWLFFVVIFLICSFIINLNNIQPIFGSQDNPNNKLSMNIKPIRILFDETRYPLQGVNNSVHTQDMDGYVKLASLLMNNSFTIDTLDYGETVNESDLAECDILVNACSFNPYLPEEIERIYSWVIAGGSFLLICDLGPFFSGSTSFIAERFGYELAQDILKDNDTNLANDAWFKFDGANIKNHDITSGVSSIEFYAGDGIFNFPIGAKALITTDDDGTTYWDSSGLPAIEVPILSVNEKWNVTLGKIAILTDTNIFEGDIDPDLDGVECLFDSDNEVLALNLFNWLGNVSTEKVSIQSIYFSFIAIFGILVYLVKRRK
ncbi:MAG: hypothetical protein ACTSO7_06660 [Candidatus Heimdallarchaeota archaeon]